MVTMNKSSFDSRMINAKHVTMRDDMLKLIVTMSNVEYLRVSLKAEKVLDLYRVEKCE